MGIVLDLAVFYILVSVFSEGAESDARWKILIIAISVTAVLSIININMPNLLGLALSCLAAGLLSVAALKFWIKVTSSQAFKITGSYIVFVFAYSIAISLIFRHAA